MKLYIQHQEQYSRGELLLRTLFGWLYIGIPHIVLMLFYSIYLMLLEMYAFLAILFTTKYPKLAFDAYVNYLNWSLRLSASLGNLVDGYPPIGPNADWEKTKLEIGYPAVVTRKRLLFSVFLSWIVLLPHIIYLYVLALLVGIIQFLAFFIVLFTGKFPKEMHDLCVGTIRYGHRVSLYCHYLYFKYPEFTMQETETDKMHLK